MNSRLLSIRTGFEGFCRILEVADVFERSKDNDCCIDMVDTSWFDANMCAPFAALLYRLGSTGRMIRLERVKSDVLAIMQKNGFGACFGLGEQTDAYGTTLQYRQFLSPDHIEFSQYIEDHFRIRRHGLPVMSEALLKAFRQSLYEIFWNAMEHSETSLGIFACGQHFPWQQQLVFTIADLGIGIRQRIFASRGQNMDASEAIEWAMSGNTTKSGPRPGGLGFKLIKEFIELNQGRIMVVSDAGYLEFKQGEMNRVMMSRPFPGTVVTIMINTADQRAYFLKSEVSQENIF